MVVRYFFKTPTDWQDEASVFMLVGATFFCTAYVQSYRGHIGIEALVLDIARTRQRRAAVLRRPDLLPVLRLFFMEVVGTVA